MAAPLRSKRAYWGLATLLGLLVLGSLGAYRLVTAFDRSLTAYAVFCEGQQVGWYDVVDEVGPDKLKDSLYYAYYWTRSRVPAKAAHGWTCNTTDGQTVPALRCQGVLYVVVHKWKNFAAGVCIPVDGRAVTVTQRGLDYFPIAGSRWQYWKADMER